MAINPLISLQARVPDIGQTFSNALLNIGRIDQLKQARETKQRQEEIGQVLGQIGQPEQLPEGQAGPTQILSQDELIQQAKQIDPVIANKQLTALGLDNPSKRAEASRFAVEVQSLPLEQQNQRIAQRVESLRSQGRNPADTLQLLQMNPQERAQTLQGVQLLDLSTKERLTLQQKKAAKTGKPAGQVEFEALLDGLTEEEKANATKIKLGLSPRAVGSAIQTITGAGSAEEVGKTSAIIKQREKFAEMTGASRAKAIDSGFGRIVKIDAGLLNIDRAIKVLEGGADTGAIKRFLPSIRAASVELDQIRNEMALDVIGGVTLGAISEKELDLTKQVALPSGLDEPALIEHLKSRRAAQEKLRGYFQEQIDFLDDGGTVAGFLRSKRRDTGAQPPAGGVVRFDRTGKRVQ